MNQTFTQFKENFYNSFEDAAIFDCGSFNTLKIVLDGLKVNYAKKQKANTFFLNSWFLYTSQIKIKQKFLWNKKYKKFEQKVFGSKNILNNKKYLIGFSSRLITEANNKNKSIYYANIINDLGLENTMYIADADIENILNLGNDFNKNEIYLAGLLQKFSVGDFELYTELCKTFYTIKQANIFDKHQLQNIEIAFEMFFKQASIWAKFLEKTTISTAIITVHYHNEGFIYACKKRGVKVVELQHGLIAYEDIFYIFPEKVKSVLSKALFADKILVYGNAWKQRLLRGYEYPESKIEVLGYYHYQPKQLSETERELNAKIENKKVALFTTQTFMEHNFSKYIQAISNVIPNDYIVIVKPHPSEKIEIYNEYFSNSKNVLIANCGLDFILSKATFNVTCYSTTVFDAMRNNVKTLAINFEQSKDYVSSLVTENLVIKVEPNQNVFDFVEQLNVINNEATDWYQTYNFNVLKNAL